MSILVRRTLMLVVFMGLIISSLAWWVSTPKEEPTTYKVYTLVAYTKKSDNVAAMEKIIKEAGFDATVKTVERYAKKPIGYRVIFEYDDKGTLQEWADFFNKRKIYTKLVEEKDTGRMYLLLVKNYKNKAEAQKVAKKLLDMAGTKFDVETNYKKYPYKAQAVKVNNIKDTKKLEELKSKLKNYAEKGIEVKEKEEEAATVDKEK